jgi:poly(hydroxyalkanoate) depolymerase family esterase
MKLDNRVLEKMQEATRLLHASGPAAAMALIQRTLSGDNSAETQGAWHMPLQPPGGMRDINPDMTRDAESGQNSRADLFARLRKGPRAQWERKMRPGATAATAMMDLAGKGQYLAGSFTNRAGTRAYKLYIPSAYHGQALPLIVMLHGCKQNPDDFAAGTGMNRIAEENNCFVVYPAQAGTANSSGCWNWFQGNDQVRDQGEPSIIADLTRDIVRTHHIDASRVYVAGLSAGGAMAAILGAAYPDLFAAAGIHSGLPVGAAHDMPSAFAAMKNGTGSARSQFGSARTAPNGQGIPVIVFHGDCDTTVHPRNGQQVLAQCSRSTVHGKADSTRASVPQGRHYTKTTQQDRAGKVVAEYWDIHGAGHAWSGGSCNGSYTDPQGPDAAQEMMRFFSMHTLRVL